jgi:intracellular septation protein A
MQRLAEFLRSAAADFGGILVFYVLMWTVGLKAAIAGTLVFVVIDAVRRHRRKLGFPKIYVLSSAMAIGFGAIDLMSATPFMIKYESVITNLVTAAIFLAGARGERSIIQELAEQQSGEAFEDRADLRRFFRLFTLLWAAYFIVKALVYLWLVRVMPLERALSVRGVIGGVSFALMLAISTQGDRLFGLCARLGLLPKVAASET